MGLLDIIIFNHLKENKMTYLQHFVISFQIGTYLLLCSTKSFIHALIPYFFKDSTEECIKCITYLLTIIQK